MANKLIVIKMLTLAEAKKVNPYAVSEVVQMYKAFEAEGTDYTGTFPYEKKNVSDKKKLASVQFFIGAYDHQVFIGFYPALNAKISVSDDYRWSERDHDWERIDR